MREYSFKEIEKKWQDEWSKLGTYKVEVDPNLPKYYILDMFPYPSGAGLHVGHPLGYIASDIVSRYKRLQGFNVLHPMGFDSFGLPAEQYAIQTGVHPAIKTEENIAMYISQLKRIGFSYDWDRMIKTSDKSYYKWTQSIFLKLFNSWYDVVADKAKPISDLFNLFETVGSNVQAKTDSVFTFSAKEWNSFSEERKHEVSLNYRLAYLDDVSVNWCPELGTVLANDEVKDGLSERGGHPVFQKKMKQWSLRISAYADRLLKGLDSLDWSDPIKEMQRNWIGKSVGASVSFTINGSVEKIEVFTTRPDTIFGVTFMVLAPEHPLTKALSTPEHAVEVEEYILASSKRTERERMTDIKRTSGAFTGAYAIHPFTNEKIPIWTSEYVLASYGTGAIMAVPAGDQRDFSFAKHFGIEIRPFEEGQDLSEETSEEKIGNYINSDFINGMSFQNGFQKVIDELEKKKIGAAKTNFRLRDAVFSRQRYWGEPFPIYFKNGLPYSLSEDELPLELPKVDKYLPTEDGEPPLARAKDWKYQDEYNYELSTMPGWAGSSWYFARYTDPVNANALAGKEALGYWQNVDFYLGGSEHATGHLIYARFWTHFLNDISILPFSEPFKKMVNQGMILGDSRIVHRIKETNKFVSAGLKDQYDTQALHVDVNMVEDHTLDIAAFKKWRDDYKDAEFILEDGKYICSSEVEKMSKRWFNVVNPDHISDSYGADALRLYEMFLGPLTDSKPWDTKGIEGVSRFIKKLWRHFNSDHLNNNQPRKEELKSIHGLIKKITEGIESISLNTCISAFMICLNELNALKCTNKLVISDYLRCLSPFAPHIAEELWNVIGNKSMLVREKWPEFNEEHLVENSYKYPLSINGKVRYKVSLSLALTKNEIEDIILGMEKTQELIGDKTVRKVIVVPGRIINIVV